MVTTDKSAPVTRREFYSALVVIWLYMALVLGDLLRIEGHWTTGVLWAASIMCLLAYSVMTLRSR